jgi:hypothetical protein
LWSSSSIALDHAAWLRRCARDARDQLVEPDGLREIVVGSRAQTFDEAVLVA